MTIDDISKEINNIRGKRNGSLSVDDIERLIWLSRERDRIEGRGVTYHYANDMTIGEIQLAAKVISAQLTEDPYRNNFSCLQCPAPIACNGDWSLFTLPADDSSYSHMFFIETPNYGKICYYLHGFPALLGLESNLFLEDAQNTFKLLYNSEDECGLKEADSLVNSFICINSSITNYFIKAAQESELFSWNAKYNPCFFDRERILNFRGWMMMDMRKEFGVTQPLVGKRYLMRDFAMQLKYLTFWVALMDTFTFPGLKESFREIYANLIDYLLKNYANIYIYDIVAESNLVENSANTKVRGSNSNTTRLKIFFTTSDNIPRLMRLDLPHIDCPYVHINIENRETGENIHQKISQPEKFSGEYDSVFESLIRVLQTYNFYSITTRHSPVSDDRAIFREMKYWTAMYDFAIPAMGSLILGSNDNINHFAVVQQSRKALLLLLQEDGVPVEDSEALNDYELFEFADLTIRKNALIP